MPLARLLVDVAPSGVPGARALVRAGLAWAFGAPPFDVGSGAGDPGLFGPCSASWRIVSEPAAIVGGIRGLLVQLMHPLAMAGVADHSRFRDDALGRLRRTSAYVTVTTFGSTDQVLAAARRVRDVHERVAGTAPDGRTYRAGDAHLLTWVSIALTSSFLATDRAYAPRPADEATADAFVAEQARAAALLDPRVDLREVASEAAALRAGTLPLPLVADGTLPLTAAGLAARLDAFTPELAVGSQAGEALRFLLWPDVPLPLRAAYLPLLAGAVATLDPADRRRLGLPASAGLALPLRLQTRALLSGLRLATGPSPTLAAATRRVAQPGDGLAA